ncbi:MAG TPA: four helix bundle protein [Terriglobales bacterium]|nr:four helix bundle protein [Terriglobales bacterium]
MVHKTVALKERTKQFALRVIRLCRAVPPSPETRVITTQLLRSATSVAANYRAVCRARSRAEFLAKLGIVIEEADESALWLELLADAQIIPDRLLVDLKSEANQLVAICNASRTTAKTGFHSKINNHKSTIPEGSSHG